MTILIINGSTHRGNTWKLVEHAKNYLVENKHMKLSTSEAIEIIY